MYPRIAWVVALALAASASEAGSISLRRLGTHESGIFAEGGAEIVAFDPGTRRGFVVNAANVTVDVLDLGDPGAPTLVGTIDASAFGASANSIAVRRGVLAVAIEANPKTAPGKVVFYGTQSLEVIGQVQVGALPDMLTFDASGDKVLVANEGEPSSYLAGPDADPEGSISIIDVSRGFASPPVCTAGFGEFHRRPAPGQPAGARLEREIPKGVRIFGPNASIAQDLEPEYITVAGQTAYVTLQENNAFAVVDIPRCRVVAIRAAGFKDHALPGQGLDASDRDGPSNSPAIRIANWPVFGMYQPDGIASYSVGGRTYLITANEGDTRDWPGLVEEVRVGSSSYVLDPTTFPNASMLKQNANLGRLTVTSSLGDHDDDGDFDAIYVPGGRSISIWDATTGALVHDTGDLIERKLAELLPAAFNSNHDSSGSFDSRSDNKGPEPEGVVVGAIEGRVYAFVGLERIGGVMVFDVSDPHDPSYVTYANPRDFTLPIAQQGDLGPEGLVFVPASDSPTERPLLIVGNEISGSTTVFEVEVGG